MDDPRFHIFVHVDANTDISLFQFESYQLQHSKLYIVPTRIRTYWGDISLFDAMISTYHYAISTGNYQWFVTLSGEDYPLHSNDFIHDYLTKQNHDLIGISECCSEIRFKGYSFWKLNNKLLVRMLRRALCLLGIKKRHGLVVDKTEWKICLASQWNALSYASVTHLINTLDRFPQIRKFFKFSHAPDELVIPTILFNSPPNAAYAPATAPLTYKTFEERAVIHFLHYTAEKGTSVTIHDENSYHEAVSSQKLFIRKVRTGKSEKLMDLLDQYRSSD